MSGEWTVSGRTWINCETFMVCLEDVLVVRKVNLDRSISVSENRLLPGIELTFQGSEVETIEIDYIEEAHRDQVYDAIWAALKGKG